MCEGGGAVINLASTLHLVRPLTVFDLETTGGSTETDRIWQISITKHYPKKQPVRWRSFINPGIPISPELINRLKVTPEVLDKVAKAPPFERYGKELATTVLTKTDYAGHNILFDLKVARAEFRRLKINWDWEKTDARVVCTLRIYQILFPRDLQAAYREFVNPAGFEGAHDADIDVRSTEEVLNGQLLKYPAIPRTVPELSDYCYPKDQDWIDRSGKFVWRHNEAHVGFGKYSGTSLQDMVKRYKGYLEWMLEKDFPDDCKAIIQDALEGKFPKR